MISSSDILRGKILIVDDQKTNILLLEKMLREAGYVSIESTMDANEVCELHRKHRYDLILLDLLMPGAGFSGFQVMEGLKEIEPGDYLPVIVITAHEGHKLHAFQVGARDFISKPFELAEVLARVRNMLEVRLLHGEMKSHIEALEQKIKEVETSRDHVRRLSDEIKRLHDKISFMEGGNAAGLSQPHMLNEAQPRVLLYVENKPESLELIKQIIARHPEFRLLTATNGNLGIEIARASLPEVILTDINLPDISGFKVLETLRSDPATAHIPIIAISSNAMPLSIEKGLEAGFFRYLTKPINVNEFMEALELAGQNIVQKRTN